MSVPPEVNQGRVARNEALHDAQLVAIVLHREGVEAEEVVEAHVGAVEALRREAERVAPSPSGSTAFNTVNSTWLSSGSLAWSV